MNEVDLIEHWQSKKSQVVNVNHKRDNFIDEVNLQSLTSLNQQR